MAKIKEKLAFGLYKDGLRVKVAQLSLNNGIVSVQSLEETILSSELLHEEVIDKEEVVVPLDKEEQEEIKLPELGEIEDETFSLPEITEFETTDEPDSTSEDSILPGLRDLQNFLQQFSLEKGKISLSANDEQISYFQFNSSYGTKNLSKRLLKELLTKEEIKDDDYSFDFILNPDNSGLAFVHTGKFKFFHALRDINLILSKEKYYYSYIDANPISLINIVNHEYDFSIDDYVLILYIGYDYKVGIILKNGMHIKTFPIIVPDDEVSMRETLYSKVLLEQDISNIPISKNILLTGDNTSDEDLEYFRSVAQEEDNISRIDLGKLKIQEGMEETITPEEIARYAIPIALAWKTLEPKNKKFSTTNLLPSKVIENQKYFKIAWHGFLILAAIFYFAFSGTIKNLELKQDINNYEIENNNVKRELARSQDMIERLNEIKAKVNKLEENIIRVERITGNKNQWNHILYAFSKSLQRNSLSWFSDLTSNNEGFVLEGYTTSRRAVIALSKLLPQSRISNVVKFEDQELVIWRFIISINYPDPKSWLETEEQVEEQPEIEVIEEKVVEEPEIVVITETPEEINEKYHSIVSLYFSGKTNDAYEQFSEFVANYPEHKMTYNAKYLIGECLYLMKRYPEARETLEQIYKLNGSKSPDALIVLGNCSEEENDLDTAVQYWSTLIEKYPNNSLSKAARYKIDKIKGR